jgi:hypothetical protein
MTKPVVKEGSTRGPNPSEIRERDAREEQKKYLDKVEKAGKPSKKKIKKRSGGKVKGYKKGGPITYRMTGGQVVDNSYD